MQNHKYHHQYVSAILYVWQNLVNNFFRCFFRPVDVEIIENKKIFDIYYVLNDAGDYDIDIKFGGRSIPDGAFSLKVE